LRFLRIALGCVLMLVLGLAALVWFMPARWAVLALEPRLHGLQLRQVGGLLWDGHAGELRSASGGNLGRLQWTLSRRALLGDVRLHLALQGPGVDFAGNLHRLSATEVVWHEVRLQADAALLDGLPPLRGSDLHGRLNVHIVDARLQGLWPMRIDAVAHWSDAVAEQGGRRVALGNFHLDAKGAGGVVQLALGDDGRSALQATGSATLSPLAWHYHAVLHPRADDPALRRWLAGFGPLSVDHALILQGKGGLEQLVTPMEQR
jgi:general secretion pathway protein N